MSPQAQKSRQLWKRTFRRRPRCVKSLARFWTHDIFEQTRELTNLALSERERVPVSNSTRPCVMRSVRVEGDGWSVGTFRGSYESLFSTGPFSKGCSTSWRLRCEISCSTNGHFSARRSAATPLPHATGEPTCKLTAVQMSSVGYLLFSTGQRRGSVCPSQISRAVYPVSTSMLSSF